MYYLIEHMEGDDVSKWVRLEYLHMAQCVNKTEDLVFTNYPTTDNFVVPLGQAEGETSQEFENIIAGIRKEQENNGRIHDNSKPHLLKAPLKEIFEKFGSSSAGNTSSKCDSEEKQLFQNYNPKKICLLDMQAEKGLSPDDHFDFVVFGGILGNITHEEGDNGEVLYWIRWFG